MHGCTERMHQANATMQLPKAQCDPLSLPSVTTKKASSAASTCASQGSLSFRLVPGDRLGSFVLGMSIGSVIKHLQNEYREFPRVDLVFDEAAKPTNDIILRLTDFGLTLNFEPILQRLRRIDFEPATKLRISYLSNKFDAWEQHGRFSRIHNLFGPCHGDFVGRSAEYFLRYPGVTFTFPVAEHSINEQNFELTRDGKFPDGSNPVIKRGSIIVGNDLNKAYPPPAAMTGDPYHGERVIIEEGRGLIFEQRNKAILFGDSCQQVLSNFGPPDATYHKGSSTRIHSRIDNPLTGVFFNYRRLGVDVLFSGTHFRATKFVIHANVPGHYNFNSHCKCNFFCVVKAGTSQQPPSAMVSSVIDQQPEISIGSSQFSTVDLKGDGECATIAPKTKGKAKRKKSLNETNRPQSLAITPETKWDQVCEVLSASLSKPVVLQQAPVTNCTNPFGTTRLWNFKSMIFEVMNNDRISTVTVCQ